MQTFPRTPNVKTKTVILHRDGQNQAWGIRLVGGVDLKAPLIISKAQVGSPSEGELKRGDIIKKIGDYDSRDLRHEDAQNLFKNAGNTITLVVQRDQAQTYSSSNTRSSSVPAVPSPLTMNPPPKGGIATPFARALAPPAASIARSSSPIVFPPPLPTDDDADNVPPPTYRHLQSHSHPAYNPASPVQSSPTPYMKSPPMNRPVSSLAAPSTMMRASSPIVFPPPMPDEVQEIQYLPQMQIRPNQLLEYNTQFRATPQDGLHDNYHDELGIAAIANQPYRTTPLVLPGAKVKKDGQPTESYLRHHPNPMFRAAPTHFDTPADVLMKQKVADTVLQRVAGEDALAGKQMVHKQFNSPIGLYSDQNIQDSIQSHPAVTPLKKTVSYDPAKSETFKALQEDLVEGVMMEVTTPAQTKVFSPAQGAMTRRAPGPGPQPYSNKPQSPAQHQSYVNSLGNNDELIHQSGTFKRLMYQVLGEY